MQFDANEILTQMQQGAHGQILSIHVPIHPVNQNEWGVSKGKPSTKEPDSAAV